MNFFKSKMRLLVLTKAQLGVLCPYFFWSRPQSCLARFMKENKHERKNSVNRMICQACREGKISLECSQEKFDRYCQCDVNIIQIIMGEVFYQSPWQVLPVTLLSPTQYSSIVTAILQQGFPIKFSDSYYQNQSFKSLFRSWSGPIEPEFVKTIPVQYKSGFQQDHPFAVIPLMMLILNMIV